MKIIISNISEYTKVKNEFDNKLTTSKKLINVAGYKQTDVNWYNEYDFWVYWLPSTELKNAHRYWFGITEAKVGKKDSYSQIIGFTFPMINEQMGGLNSQRTGCFIKDEDNNYYIGHRGRINKGTLLGNPVFSQYIETVIDGDKTRDVLVVAKITNNDFLLKNLGKFILLKAKEYHANDYSTDSMIFKEQNIDKMIIRDLESEIDLEIKSKSETEKEAIVKQRIGQSKLRENLLKIYDNRCAMCAVDDPLVLRTSHIVKWSEDELNRLNLNNVILLCGLHDLAFENNLIEIDEEFNINIKCGNKGLKSVLEKITSNRLDLPNKKEYYPSKELLRRKKLKLESTRK